ncbi:protein kilB [Streptomyces sp. SID8381]|uniref:hypothetical protein n=1 Tax=Streptomyces sp. Amel2xE9 TaxID=1157634 RepID=UPI000487D972|nr:hypothetical protein [Streptomyces sp. SID8381]MYX27354.1 protein kilB [Streptomyces sp. SID8381]
MWASLIAVAGTLLGSVTTFLLQQRSTDRAALRRDRLTAVTALTVALADHRRAMWVREDLRLSGADAAAYDAARARSHDTRSAITAPLTTLSILAPALARVAQDAATATYRLRDAESPQALNAAREAAIAAGERLTREAAKTF